MLPPAGCAWSGTASAPPAAPTSSSETRTTIWAVVVPGRQVPNAQKSPVVQSFPSSQAFALLVKTHPVPGSQLSVVHTLWSSQTTGVPTHAPPTHVSPVVQAFASEQEAVLFA